MSTVCYQLREVTLTLDEDEALLVDQIARDVNIPKEKIRSWKIVRRGIDARRKGRILRVYTVHFTVDAAVEIAHGQEKRLIKIEAVTTPDVFLPTAQPKRVVVVGMGPAGLFAALTLARCGHRVCLVERGKPVEQRVSDVESFWSGGPLNPRSNVQFGEGGAGTFSDGKLTTRLKHPLTRTILETLVAFGAPQEILCEAKPHVGTDRLRQVLLHFRQELQRLGVDIRYESCVTDLVCSAAQRVQGVIINEADQVACDAVILAVGHSARDTYAWLEKRGVLMEPKPFAMGVRVEHPATLINRIQYGMDEHRHLPTADYALTYNDRETGRGVYSFCMCPGGQVVQSASEPDSVVVNGMSCFRRQGPLSNSALVVSIRREDFADDSVLAGVRFQQTWERRAFQLAGGDYRAPAQNLMAFLGKAGKGLTSSCRPGVVETDLEETLPSFVSEGLKKALPHFEQKMRGFVTTEATLVGVETRTSAPIRILRHDDGQSVNCTGLYPCGEGAGYAGGIMSAALDGIQQALAIHRADHITTGESRFE